MHDISSIALCCATATSEVKEEDIPDPRLTKLCNEFMDVFAEPGMLPERDVTHDIVLREGAALPNPSIYRMLPAELKEV